MLRLIYISRDKIHLKNMQTDRRHLFQSAQFLHNDIFNMILNLRNEKSKMIFWNNFSYFNNVENLMDTFGCTEKSAEVLQQEFAAIETPTMAADMLEILLQSFYRWFPEVEKSVAYKG